MDLVTVSFDQPRRVATLTLNRPDKRNALSIALLQSLIDACASLNREPDLRAVVVTGAGVRAFSAGFDLNDFASGDRSGMHLGGAATDALDRVKAVTIAAIQGSCIGGGVVLASACDLRIAATNTIFKIPEIDLGIPLGWSGLPRLVRELGPAVAKELILTCRGFDAFEAKALRFVNQVVEPPELHAAAQEMARSIAAKPRLGVLLTKQQARIASENMVATHQSDMDAVLIAAAGTDEESRATSRAYLAK